MTSNAGLPDGWRSGDIYGTDGIPILERSTDGGETWERRAFKRGDPLFAFYIPDGFWLDDRHGNLYRTPQWEAGLSCDTCGGSGRCLYPSIEDQALISVPCPDCQP